MNSQIVTLYTDLVGANLFNDSDTILKTTEAALIPPKSEALILVIVPHHFGTGLAIVEPSVNLHRLQLALARSIVSPVNNRTVCKVMNPTDVARFLERKTTLGVIHKLYLDSVTVIDDNVSNSSTSQIHENEVTVPFSEQLDSLAAKGITLQQNSLTLDEFHSLTELIYRNKDLFATSMHDLVGTNVETMPISTFPDGFCVTRIYG